MRLTLLLHVFFFNYVLFTYGQVEEASRIAKEADIRLYDDPTESLRISKVLDSLATRSGSDSLKALALNKLGAAYWSLGDQLQALASTQASLQLAESNKFEQIVSLNLRNIGDIYGSAGLHLDAIDYYRQELARQQIDSSRCAINLRIGHAFLELRKLDSASYYFEKVRSKSTFLSPKYPSILYSDLAEVAWLQGNQKQTKANLDSARKALEYTKSVRGEIVLNRLEAELALEAAQLETASAKARKAVALALNSQAKQLIYEAYQTLSKVYGASGDYEKAFVANNLYTVYKDSVQNINTVNELELLSYYQRLFRMRVLESKNDTNSQRAEQRQLIIYSLVIILLIATGLIATIVNRGQKIRLQKAKLEELDAFKNKIFAIVSHDLKSPIQSVSSIVEMFNAKLISEEEIKPYLPEVRERTSRLLDLLNNIFQWAEGQMEGSNLRKEQFNIGDILAELQGELGERIEQKKIELDIASGNFWICSNPGIVRIVFRNLLVNAIKFSSTGSTVRVVFRAEDRRKMVTVEDQGVGIPHDVLQKLFSADIESTAGTAGEQGNGLGLALCNDFMRTLGGEIRVKSELGKGSLFTVVFPDQEPD